MKDSELQAILSKITYKPGWDLVVMVDRRAMWITRRVVDSRHAGDMTMVMVGSQHPIPPLISEFAMSPMSVESVKAWVRMELRRCEMHELDEFLRYDGEIINDPHANGRNDL